MTATTRAPSRTKKPTPLSTRSLAAFLTWKQFDLLLLLKTEGSANTGSLSSDLEGIVKYDIKHGGAFYSSASWNATYSCLRTLASRRLVDRHLNDQTGYIEWTVSDRGRKALEGLE